MGLFKKWKPKKKIGKVLKGVVIGGLGAAAVATGVGAVAGAIGGGGLLAGAVKGLGSAVGIIKKGGKVVKKTMSKVSGSAKGFITGQNSENLEIIKQAKEEAKKALQSDKAVTKLMKLGFSENEARSKLGLSPIIEAPALTDDENNNFLSGLRDKLGLSKTAGTQPDAGTVTDNKKLLMYGGLGLAAIFLLPKILKR